MIDVIFVPGGKVIDTRRTATKEAVQEAFIALIQGMAKAARDGNYFLLDSLTSCAYEGIRRYEELGGFRDSIDCYSDESSARLIEADSWQVYYTVHDYCFRLKCEMSGLTEVYKYGI